ncbi:hypothetical protein BACCAP_00045 [Pseudoflavonifractor capillosus ATCC 29799]|uniref:Uncharacterized protein n=1 Tax=Pseudoflavonifractor capillosus ATCC 29799 TaxID=411467 RepID=A6NPD0_9FIRM|nr:hypothetical protein BACCAP_00045 [Pseudoflavonifractor capillosus ATCC 29799]
MQGIWGPCLRALCFGCFCVKNRPGAAGIQAASGRKRLEYAYG